MACWAAITTAIIMITMIVGSVIGGSTVITKMSGVKVDASSWEGQHWRNTSNRRVSRSLSFSCQLTHDKKLAKR